MYLKTIKMFTMIKNFLGLFDDDFIFNHLRTSTKYVAEFVFHTPSHAMKQKYGISIILQILKCL